MLSSDNLMMYSNILLVFKIHNMAPPPLKVFLLYFISKPLTYSATLSHISALGKTEFSFKKKCFSYHSICPLSEDFTVV